MDHIRILIVDDHPLFRLGMRTRLELEPSLLVIGEAGTGEEAITMIPTCQPDVILMDLNFGEGMNGLTAIEHMHHMYPHIKLLVITMFDDDQVFAAIRAGARGYIVKDTDPSDAVRAIYTVSRGEAIFSPKIAERVLQYLTSPPPRQSCPFSELTPREREILILMAEGYTNQAIATHLHLSDKTIRNQVSSIYSKLEVANRASAIILARERGLGATPPESDEK